MLFTIFVKVVLYSAVFCRYEVNPDMVPQLEAAGLAFVGKDETGERMEIVELQDNPAVSDWRPHVLGACFFGSKTCVLAYKSNTHSAGLACSPLV
jgi:hypothetical protein